MTKRFCVFCGKRPVSRTKEHVVPLWLIKLTGDPKREILLGNRYGTLPERETQVFADFVFPACEECNAWSHHEIDDPAKELVPRLLDGAPLSAADMSLLLDLLDKVRMGLWLGYYHQRGNNPLEVTRPHHIRDSVGRTDRMVAIYRIANEDRKGIALSGISLPAFGLSPSCFALVINDLVLFNMAAPFVFSRSFGLPWAANLRMAGGDPPNEWTVSLYPGEERVERPSLEPHIAPFSGIWNAGTEIYQAVVDRGVSGAGLQETHSEWYDTAYARSLLDPVSGCTAPHIVRSDSMVPYPEMATRDWAPVPVGPFELVMARLKLQILDVQNWLLTYMWYESDHPASQVVDATISFNMRGREAFVTELTRFGGVP
jgi:hypothetical protein